MKDNKRFIEIKSIILLVVFFVIYIIANESPLNESGKVFGLSYNITVYIFSLFVAFVAFFILSRFEKKIIDSCVNKERIFKVLIVLGIIVFFCTDFCPVRWRT